jgi:hypothetical protein
MVVLAPEPPKRHLRDRFKFTPSDQNGAFELQGVAPGKYKLFAWDRAAYGAWEDPNFLSPFEGRGDPIEVQEDETVAVRLRLIETQR